MQYDENAEKYGYEGEMTPLKCDKLTAYKGDVYIPVYGSIADADVYLKKDVDAAIAELKQNLENAQASAYAESVDSGMEIRRLKHALWIARAEIAHKKIDEYWPDYCHNAHSRIALLKWEKVERKCLKKAEEYK